MYNDKNNPEVGSDILQRRVVSQNTWMILDDTKCTLSITDTTITPSINQSMF